MLECLLCNEKDTCGQPGYIQGKSISPTLLFSPVDVLALPVMCNVWTELTCADIVDFSPT